LLAWPRDLLGALRSQLTVMAAAVSFSALAFCSLFMRFVWYLLFVHIWYPDSPGTSVLENIPPCQELDRGLLFSKIPAPARNLDNVLFYYFVFIVICHLFSYPASPGESLFAK